MAVSSLDRTLAGQVESLGRLHDAAVGGSAGPERKAAARTWGLVRGPGYLVSREEVYDAAKSVGAPCRDPRSVESAFALDEVTLYPYPRGMLRPAGKTAGLQGDSVSTAVGVRGISIQSVETPTGVPTFVVSVCTNDGAASRTVVFDQAGSSGMSVPDPLQSATHTDSRGDGDMLAIDFESEAPGIYDSESAREGWATEFGELAGFDVVPEGSLTVRSDQLVKGSRNTYLRKAFSVADYSSRGNTTLLSKMQMRWNLDRPQDSAQLSFDFRTPVGFPAMLGGKLPGFCGGSCPTGGRAPTDRRTHEGENDPSGDATGFSARTMWGRGGYLYQYLYYPDQISKFAQGFQYRVGDRSVYVGDGGWHSIKQSIKMNTPGERDGSITVWFDDRPVLQRSDVRFRDEDRYGIDRLLIHLFFGGGSEDAAPTADTWIDLDNIVLQAAPNP